MFESKIQWIEEKISYHKGHPLLSNKTQSSNPNVIDQTLRNWDRVDGATKTTVYIVTKTTELMIRTNHIRMEELKEMTWIWQEVKFCYKN